MRSCFTSNSLLSPLPACGKREHCRAGAGTNSDRRQHDHRDHDRHHPRKDRLDQTGAPAVRGVHDRADRDAAVVACGLQRHRQGQPPDAAEFRHAVHRSRLPRSAVDHRDHRHHLRRDLLRGRGADGMAGVAHRHARAAVHPRAGHGLVRDAAISRRGRLGVAGGAQQRTAQPAVSFRHRCGGRRSSVQHLFDDRNHFCHLLLYLSFRVRARCQRARQHAGRTRGCFRHPRRQGLDHGAARHHSAGAPCPRRRLADRLSAGHDPVRLAGDPGAAGRLSHHDHENLEPVPVSAETRTRRRRRRAAAAADDIAAAGAEIHPGPPRLFGVGRQIRRAAPGRDEEVALGGAGVLPGGAAQSGFPAVFRAAQRRVLAERHHAGDAVDADACAISCSCSPNCRRPSSRSRTP